MRNRRRTMAALLAGTVSLGLGACGGSSKHASTTTTTGAGAGATSTTGTSTTATKTKSGKSKALPLSQTPATTLSYSGTGPKELGIVRIPKDATIKWTNDAPAAVRIFQVIPASVKVQSPVNSREASGQAPIRKGAYHGFLVNADGKWTMKIVPN